MTNMDDVVTKEFLKDTLTEAFAAFEERLAVRFEAIENRLGNLDARVEIGFSELDERLDAEQRFTSDMWDDFAHRLAALEAK